jgi:hypothetical protein
VLAVLRYVHVADEAMARAAAPAARGRG